MIRVTMSGDSEIVPLAVRCGSGIGTCRARTRSSRIVSGGRDAAPGGIACSLALNACGSAFRQRPNLFERRHGGVTRERGQKSSVRPPEADRFLGLFAVQQTVDESCCVAVTTADAIVH